MTFNTRRSASCLRGLARGMSCWPGGRLPAGRSDAREDRVEPAADRQRQAAVRHDRAGHPHGDRGGRGRVGPFRVEYLDLDDSTAAAGQWTSEAEAANARRALQDPDVVAYIGTFNSGAAKVSMPILNLGDLLMVSPANTAVGLTKPGLGAPGEPEVYRPTGRLNYTRVVPADDLQGPLSADWAKKRGVKTGLHPRRQRGLRKGNRRPLRRAVPGDRHRGARPRLDRRQGAGVQVADGEHQGGEARPRLLSEAPRRARGANSPRTWPAPASPRS
jgi:hypothetical protein